MSEAARTQQIIDRHDQYMSINYGRYPIAMVRGEGSRLFDAEGKEYLDFFAGFGAAILGHCQPDLVQAVTDQAKAVWHPGNLFHTEPQTLLAEAVAKAGFGGRSFFCHSGADANEAALKLARLYGKERPKTTNGRYMVISAQKSFHGRTFGTMMATGQEKVRAGFQPFLPGFMQVPYNDIQAIEQAIEPHTVAILLEPIQGEGGINVPSPEYLPAVRKLCDQHDLLLIIDEVWTGGGRTGRFFAHQHWNITPDIMTMAKGVGGGLPVGIMCAKHEVADLYNYKRHGGAIHATTLGGNCLSMAVANAVFRVVERDHLLEHATRLGKYLSDRLNRLSHATPIIREVRGKGLFVGIELDCDNEQAWFDTAKQVVDRCLQQGLYTNATQGNVLRLAPPINITQQDLEKGLGILERVITG